MSHSANTTSSRPIQIHDRLAREWQHLTITAAALATVRGWLLPGGSIDSLDEVLVRSGYIPYTPGAGQRRREPRNAVAEAEADAFLVELLRLAKVEPLAARAVLQRILPALCSLARRHAAGRGTDAQLLDELVANAWPVIRSYPVERRPQRVIANLVRDIGFQTVVRPTRRMNASEIPVSPEHLDRIDEPSTEPLLELSDVLRTARAGGVIDDDEMELVRRLLATRQTDVVAEAMGVTGRAVRYRRTALERRLRRFVLAADAA